MAQRARHHARSAVLAGGIAVVCLMVLLSSGASSVVAKPKTLHAGAYDVMKEFMTMWDKKGFAEVVDLGGGSMYRIRLEQCKIVLDTHLVSSDGRPLEGRYGPERNVIYLRRDPRKATASGRIGVGNTVWHEVTHALEDRNGDDMSNADPDYQDRHTYYMDYVARTVLNYLSNLERKAASGASVADLKATWKKYQEQLTFAAGSLEQTKKYPPDLELMRRWFGWTASDREAVREMYLTDKAFAGDKWKNLREAVSLPDWSGTWQTNLAQYGFACTKIVFAQTGDKVTGKFKDVPVEDHELKGAANGSVLTGTWMTWFDLDARTGRNIYDFELTMSDDGLTFTGWWEPKMLDGQPVDGYGRNPWSGSRP
jgi:hypothetical protein